MGNNNSSTKQCISNTTCINYLSPSTQQPDLTYYISAPCHLFSFPSSSPLQPQQFPIYTSHKKPSSYIIKAPLFKCNTRTYNLFQLIQNNQLPQLVSLHAYEFTRTTFFTLSLFTCQSIISYWQYYNYFFVEYLTKRSLKSIQSQYHVNNARKLPFQESQVWLIIKTWLDVYALFDKYNVIIDVDIDKMVLIPEGKVKVYWNHVELEGKSIRVLKDMNKIRKTVSQYQQQNQCDINNHSTINQQHNITNQYHINKQTQKRNFFIQSQSQHQDSFYYSPEEIQFLLKYEETLLKSYGQESNFNDNLNNNNINDNFNNNCNVFNKINFNKTNSFRLGMIILYCVTLINPIKTCYGLKKNKNMSNTITDKYNNKSTNLHNKINPSIPYLKPMVLTSIIQSKLESSSKYSAELKTLIKQLLSLNPFQRISMTQIKSMYVSYMLEQTELMMGLNSNNSENGLVGNGGGVGGNNNNNGNNNNTKDNNYVKGKDNNNLKEKYHNFIHFNNNNNNHNNVNHNNVNMNMNYGFTNRQEEVVNVNYNSSLNENSNINSRMIDKFNNNLHNNNNFINNINNNHSRKSNLNIKNKKYISNINNNTNNNNNHDNNTNNNLNINSLNMNTIHNNHPNPSIKNIPTIITSPTNHFTNLHIPNLPNLSLSSPTNFPANIFSQRSQTNKNVNFHQINKNNFNSKFIQQNKTSSRDQDQDQDQEDNSFDKFDTKTIKMLNTYSNSYKK